MSTTTAAPGSITAILARDKPICPRCGGQAYPGLLCEPCNKVSWAEAFRPHEDYTLAHRCPTCKAPPWVDCDAPGLAARRASLDALRAQVGGEPETYSLPPQHATRQDRARRHYYRDVGKAPWPEAREPGKSYSTIPPRPVERVSADITADISTPAADISVRSAAPPSPTADAGDPPAFWRQLI